MPGLHDRVAAYLRAHEADLIAFRRDLHRHPEVSGGEVRTARVVAERLRAIGLAVRTGVGGHGVVGTLEGGRPGPLVAYRADMDAVPSADADPVEFRSTVPGVRHICGHDVHVAIAIGLAGALADVRADLAGSVMFIFQPAEERATGAQAMVDAGLFAGAMPAAIFGLHTSPLEVGRLGVKSGVMMAARDRLRVSLAGTGDLEAAAARVRAALESVSTLRPDQIFTPAPEGFALVRLGPTTTRGETRVFGGQVTVAGEARRAQVRGAIASTLTALSTSGVRVDHQYLPGADAAGVTNDPALTSRTVEAIRGVLGDVVTTITTIPPAFSEDFGVFQARVAGHVLFPRRQQRLEGHRRHATLARLRCR